jgi:hypothetical protein
MAGLHIRRNRLSGGGAFVLEIWGEGYRDVVVERNFIHATNRGTQGVARVHHSTFIDNECVIGPASGKAREYFIHLQGTTHRGNSYRNQSPHSMYAALRGTRNLGRENYIGPRLNPLSEPI